MHPRVVAWGLAAAIGGLLAPVMAGGAQAQGVGSVAPALPDSQASGAATTGAGVPLPATVNHAAASGLIAPPPGPAGPAPASAVHVLPGPAAPSLTPAQQQLLQHSSASVTVVPGPNNIFPVALNYVNRIVTPFSSVGVSTSAGQGIEVRQNVVYVTPQSEAPITMFLTQHGDESVAVSVTLVPRLIPPVQIELRLPDEIRPVSLVQPHHDAAPAWRPGRSYLDGIRDLLREVAMDQMPSGYDLKPAGQKGLRLPVCAAPGFAVEFRRGQYLLGDPFEVFVGLVVNRSGAAAEFTESWCEGPGVVAVALSPAPMLLPGGTAEIYVVRREPPPEPEVTPRPSLLGARQP